MQQRRLVPARPPELERMEAYAREHGFPIIGPACGHLCYQLARTIGARQVFELGSGYGYSTAFFARAVRDNGGGAVHHVVWDEALSRRARRHLDALGDGDLVRDHVGEAVQALQASANAHERALDCGEQIRAVVASSPVASVSVWTRITPDRSTPRWSFFDYDAPGFDFRRRAFQYAFILSLVLARSARLVCALVEALVLPAVDFLCVDLVDALFLVALAREAGLLCAAARRVVGVFFVDVCFGGLSFVRGLLRSSARRGAVSPSDPSPAFNSMPKTDDTSSVCKRRRRPLCLVVGASVIAAAINSAGWTPRSANSISGSWSRRAPTP